MNSNEAFQMQNGKDKEWPTCRFSDKENYFIRVF